jgi:drug/metabolite transporter (DMT)-like permease
MLPPAQEQPAVPPKLVLLAAILGISLAAPLIRLSEAHPLAIAIWRLFFSMPLVLAMVLASGSWRQWKTLGKRDLGIAVGGGIMLALHFWSWNTSVRLTTVAASVVLVNLQPVIVALISAAWLHEAPTRSQKVGIAIAMLGALLVALPDFRSQGLMEGRNPLLGDALALFGGVTAALYYLGGRRLRQTLDLWAYVALVYGACLVALLVIAVLAEVPLGGQSNREYAIFAGLALGPMMLGHTGFNWALRYLRAYVVSVAVLCEPLGATILAALIPGIAEIPSLWTVFAGLVIIAGVALTLRPTVIPSERTDSSP